MEIILYSIAILIIVVGIIALVSIILSFVFGRVGLYRKMYWESLRDSVDSEEARRDTTIGLDDFKSHHHI